MYLPFLETRCCPRLLASQTPESRTSVLQLSGLGSRRGGTEPGIGCCRPTPFPAVQCLSSAGACAVGWPWGGGGKRYGAVDPMSALRRSGYGPSDGPSYGRFYGPGGGDVPMHPPPPLYPPRPEPPQPPISWRVRGGGLAETDWPGEGGGGDGYYASAGAWSETGRAGGNHQVRFAPSVPGGSDKGILWRVRAIGIDKAPEFVMDRVSYLFSLWGVGETETGFVAGVRYACVLFATPFLLRP